MKKNINIQKAVQWALKVLLSALALYLVYKKVDPSLLKSIVKKLDFLWLIPAFIFFNISKIFSSVRLNGLLNNIGIRIEHQPALKLYYKGMFYNLFLPGGIGGDAYKAYILNKGNDIPLKKIIGTLLYDRLSGLVMLGFISGVLWAVVMTKFSWLGIAGALIVIPLGYIATGIFFKSHKQNFTTSQFYSLVVQFSQVLSVICILKALQVKFIMYLSYLLLFMVSSVAAVIPVTIGGAGAREVVFLYGKKLVDINPEKGIMIGLIFFLITAVSSFIGIIFNTKNPEQD